VKPIFRRSPTLTIRLMVFAALSVGFMTLEHRSEKLQLVRDFFAQLVYPVQYLVTLPSQAYDEMANVFTSHQQLLAENQQLRQTQTLLESRLQTFNSLAAENQRLQRLLHASRKIRQRVLVAEMLAVDLDPYRQKVLVNKGSRDDVYVGQPVIDAKGIMGQITQVSKTSATALLISDPSHAIPVTVVRNGLRSIANGIGTPNLIRLDYIPGNGDIEAGDMLVSSGLGGRFPRDLPVATVTRVDRKPGKPFAQVFARPAASLDRGHQVLLVWKDEPARDQHHRPEVIPEYPTHGKLHWPSIERLAAEHSAHPLTPWLL